jgi:hypothetical protein
VAVLLCAFVNKSALTDPSTWGMGADAAVENSPLYDQSAGGQVNQLYGTLVILLIVVVCFMFLLLLLLLLLLCFFCC